MPDYTKLRLATPNRIEQIKKALEIYAVLMKSQLSDLQFQVMAHLVYYGISDKTKNMIVNDLKLCGTLNSYKKIMVVLRKQKFLGYDEENKTYVISDVIKLDLKSKNILILINLKGAKVGDEVSEKLNPGDSTTVKSAGKAGRRGV